ncbi:hypothetical protein EJ05DRAFT_516604 [Pseudovirgaria hyperparasitica]|uniref:RNase H type-1 domain-containing protein n=1 Tax=Pseudovirgaria hyperparasitica TaxID=470096 RepID=A0A6A6WLV6_9PEZI|nr:uncharacterized protein EJ05DRAFT_516604 [Pseudovirgaria hyperparasitica]KAF2763153.1 hypothetical protein EJ05DRAFT_516604 [Pseudovirgaria hyperparasitica]
MGRAEIPPGRHDLRRQAPSNSGPRGTGRAQTVAAGALGRRHIAPTNRNLGDLREGDAHESRQSTYDTNDTVRCGSSTASHYQSTAIYTNSTPRRVPQTASVLARDKSSLGPVSTSTRRHETSSVTDYGRAGSTDRRHVSVPPFFSIASLLAPKGPEKRVQQQIPPTVQSGSTGRSPRQDENRARDDRHSSREHIKNEAPATVKESPAQSPTELMKPRKRKGPDTLFSYDDVSSGQHVPFQGGTGVNWEYSKRLRRNNPNLNDPWVARKVEEGIQNYLKGEVYKLDPVNRRELDEIDAFLLRGIYSLRRLDLTLGGVDIRSTESIRNIREDLPKSMKPIGYMNKDIFIETESESCVSALRDIEAQQTVSPVSRRFIFWTDASRFTNPFRAGISVVWKYNRKWEAAGYNIQEPQEVEFFESVAVAKALRNAYAYLENSGPPPYSYDTVVIYTDCERVLRDLARDHPEYPQCHFARHEIWYWTSMIRSLKLTVEFRWIKSHVKICGNDLADRIAKQAANWVKPKGASTVRGGLKSSGHRLGTQLAPSSPALAVTNSIPKQGTGLNMPPEQIHNSSPLLRQTLSDFDATLNEDNSLAKLVNDRTIWARRSSRHSGVPSQTGLSGAPQLNPVSFPDTMNVKIPSDSRVAEQEEAKKTEHRKEVSSQGPISIRPDDPPKTQATRRNMSLKDYISRKKLTQASPSGSLSLELSSPTSFSQESTLVSPDNSSYSSTLGNYTPSKEPKDSSIAGGLCSSPGTTSPTVASQDSTLIGSSASPSFQAKNSQSGSSILQDNNNSGETDSFDKSYSPLGYNSIARLDFGSKGSPENAVHMDNTSLSKDN